MCVVILLHDDCNSCLSSRLSHDNDGGGGDDDEHDESRG